MSISVFDNWVKSDCLSQLRLGWIGSDSGNKPAPDGDQPDQTRSYDLHPTLVNAFDLDRPHQHDVWSKPNPFQALRWYLSFLVRHKTPKIQKYSTTIPFILI